MFLRLILLVFGVAVTIKAFLQYCALIEWGEAVDVPVVALNSSTTLLLTGLILIVVTWNGID